MPAELAVTYAAGPRDTIRLPVDMWNLGSRFEYHVAGGRHVTGVIVDPRKVLPDIERQNNRWPR